MFRQTLIFWAILAERFGKGYNRAGIFRMVKVARAFPDAEIVATLSRQKKIPVDSIARELLDRKETE